MPRNILATQTEKVLMFKLFLKGIFPHCSLRNWAFKLWRSVSWTTLFRISLFLSGFSCLQEKKMKISEMSQMLSSKKAAFRYWSNAWKPRSANIKCPRKPVIRLMLNLVRQQSITEAQKVINACGIYMHGWRCQAMMGESNLWIKRPVVSLLYYLIHSKLVKCLPTYSVNITSIIVFCCSSRSLNKSLYLSIFFRYFPVFVFGCTLRNKCMRYLSIF